MRPGSLAYRCRQCGAVFHPCHTPDGPTMLRVLLDGELMPKGWSGVRPRLLEVHRCSGRLDGVADFAGIQYDEIAPR